MMEMGIGYWVVVIAALYAWLIGVFTTGWLKRSESPVVSRQSSVTVVVAAKDEEKNIENLLQDLFIQDYPGELTEIVIIDDHSNDKTPGIVSEFILKVKTGRFKLLRFDDSDLSGKKAAISFGIDEASGEIILTTDADCRLGKSWISAMVAAFRDDTRMVFGPVSYIEQAGLVAKFQSMEFLGLVTSGAGAAMAGHPFMCNGASLAYRKEAFLQVNGFVGNEKFISGDDVFLLHKMKKEFGEGAVVFCKDEKALVKTYPVKGMRKFFSQRIRWASKSKGYKDLIAISTALIVFAFNLMLSATFITGFFYPLSFLLFAGLLLLKSLAELPLMWGVTGFTGNRGLMKWYLPFQVVYPFYIVVAGVMSLFPTKRW
jgi:cellulose synthase/poly-beta-1,6-N-acetylglucosamine synthase-like glycosyltransferase